MQLLKNEENLSDSNSIVIIMFIYKWCKLQIESWYSWKAISISYNVITFII